MERHEAVKLLREALYRIEQPARNANGGNEQVGGAYWRLAKVIEQYLFPRLAENEGAAHAKFIINNHGMICRNRSAQNKSTNDKSIEPFLGPSKRVRNCLTSAGITTFSAAYEAYDGGTANALLRIPNFGRRSLAEFERWIKLEIISRDINEKTHRTRTTGRL